MNNHNVNRDPYINIDRRDLDKVDFDKIDNEEKRIINAAHTGSNFKQRIHRTKKVYKRNVALSIIYTIITFGIYGMFWQFEIAKETNGITKNYRCATPALVVFLSIITFGIYQIYWGFHLGKKHNSFYEYHGNAEKDYHVLYMVLFICNLFLPLMSMICYAIMQSKINDMIVIANEENPEGIYVKDSSIFNRPFWSTIILVLVAQNFPGFITQILESAFPEAPGNPGAIAVDISSATDIMQKTIQNSADQIIYADTPFMIAYSILSILSVIAVLWWFKLRYKHSSYTGVLVFKNLGRACLFALPGLIFVAINLIGTNIENFKIGIILLGFIPAFSEEISFRGMIIPNLLRIYNRSKGIWLSLFASAAIFGLIHAANIFAGADVGTTIFQVCYAFALGMLFAGILIRTGNLWTCILIHGLTDAFAMMADEALQQGAVQTQAFTLTWDVLPIIVISAFYIFYSIWICRPKKHDQILSMWNQKWGSAVLGK